ncbi:MAG TPA: acyl-CoA dehydrogenase family protein [Pseudomonadales bacterium]|nr:acyl-CoA dehydrogenase family protein [Pseudomonadales bacterium]
MAALTEEQTLIRDQAKSWVTEQSPVRKFRELRDAKVPAAYAPDAWKAMVEMGWTGILVPEEYGGSDLGYLTFGLILEELGRQLTASPLLASALAGTSAVLLGGSDAQKQQWLPQVVDGSAVLTLAVDEGPRHAPERIATTAKASGDGYVIDGTKSFVLEGMAATAFVVAARLDGSDETALLLVPADAAGVTRTALATADSRGYARVAFAGVTVGDDALLASAPAGTKLLEAVLDRARAGVAAEMLGTALQAFDMTLEYLKTRKQFGKVIGSFQGLGHRAADMFSGGELTRSCVEAALQAIDSGADDVAELTSLAKTKAGDYLHLVSNELIQMHGGIGMTDEYDAGFYLKRARALEATYGNQAFHRERYARILGY